MAALGGLLLAQCLGDMAHIYVSVAVNDMGFVHLHLPVKGQKHHIF